MISILRLVGVFLVAFAIPAASWAASADELYRAAKKEGTVTWYSSIKKKINQKVALQDCYWHCLLLLLAGSVLMLVSLYRYRSFLENTR